MIRRPPRSTQSRSSAASDVYKRQLSFLPHSHSPPPLYWGGRRSPQPAPATAAGAVHCAPLAAARGRQQDQPRLAWAGVRKGGGSPPLSSSFSVERRRRPGPPPAGFLAGRGPARCPWAHGAVGPSLIKGLREQPQFPSLSFFLSLSLLSHLSLYLILSLISLQPLLSPLSTLSSL